MVIKKRAFMNQTKLLTFFLLSFLAMYSSSAYSFKPVLLFSDLISGPKTGLNDGDGSGVIVTVWGQNVSSIKSGNSSVQFTDSNGNVVPVAKIYYWKNADGILPGGPANLFKSHRMQEIAFSIPNSVSLGAGTIHIVDNGVESNKLPFTIRNGNIYHIKVDGDDSGDGSFTNAWRTVARAIKLIDVPGAIIYIHDSLAIGSETTDRGIYWNNKNAVSDLSRQFGFIAYPNSQPSVTSYKLSFSSFNNYGAGMVVSKFKSLTSNCDVNSLGQPINCNSNVAGGIRTTAFGRVIANRLTERAGGCSDARQGAIVGGANVDSAGLDKDQISGVKVFGNEVHDYGCNGTSKFQHTTYLTIRNTNGLQVAPWEWGWNYLHDNKAKNGIHQYDEALTAGKLCGSPNGTVKIHDNVIVNQAGAGISVGVGGGSSLCTWDNDWAIYNNLLINTGLAAAWDGINVNSSNAVNSSAISFRDKAPPGGGLTGPIFVTNNTLFKWNDDNVVAGNRSCLGITGGLSLSVEWNDNVCLTDKDISFESVDSASKNGFNNVWYTSINSHINAVAPSWDSGKLLSNPKILINIPQVSVSKDSPVIDSGRGETPVYDIYGNLRGTEDIGAVEYSPRPNPPSVLLIN